MALKFAKTTGNSAVLDVRWETCARIAELLHGRLRRQQTCSGRVGGGEGIPAVAALQVVTPVTAALLQGDTYRRSAKDYHHHSGYQTTANTLPTTKSVAIVIPPPPDSVDKVYIVSFVINKCKLDLRFKKFIHWQLIQYSSTVEPQLPVRNSIKKVTNNRI